MKRALLAAGLALAVSVDLPAAAEVRTHVLTLDEERRAYILFTPGKPRSAGKEIPLVIALHGGGGSAAQMESFSGFDAIAEREGFAVAYPQGTGRRWNDGRAFQGRGETDADDVAYIRAMVADIAERIALDRRRIYATGISNGGFMSLRLACEAADLVAAVAPVTATMPADLGKGCKPSVAVSVLVINGTADGIVPYAGGQVSTMFGPRGEIWSTDRTIGFWAEHNGCGKRAESRVLPDRDTSDGSHVIEVTYTGCAYAPVRLLRVEGGGHTWPGGPQYLPVGWVGHTNRDINASEVIWEFFKSVAR